VIKPRRGECIKSLVKPLIGLNEHAGEIWGACYGAYAGLSHYFRLGA
jgi:hypothetical protein